MSLRLGRFIPSRCWVGTHSIETQAAGFTSGKEKTEKREDCGECLCPDTMRRRVAISSRSLQNKSTKGCNCQSTRDACAPCKGTSLSNRESACVLVCARLLLVVSQCAGLANRGKRAGFIGCQSAWKVRVHPSAGSDVSGVGALSVKELTRNSMRQTPCRESLPCGLSKTSKP